MSMQWEGFDIQEGTFRGHEYGIVFPHRAAAGNPYIWRTEFFGAFPYVDIAMLDKGYAVVYYRISDLYGCRQAVEKMKVFQDYIEEEYKLAKKAILEGFSRGGLYALHYAASCPSRIEALYLDAPVVDIYSWPAGQWDGIGGQKEWEECNQLWGMEHTEYMTNVKATLNTLLTSQIPLVIVAGGADEVVPYHENGKLLQDTYEASDVPFAFYFKPTCGHHPHSLEDPTPVVDFLISHRRYETIGNSYRLNDQSLY